MAKTVTINGIDYTLNQQGDEQPWGENEQAILEALIEVSNNSLNEGDILNRSFVIANDVSVAAPVTGAVFDVSSIRGFIMEYSLYRASSTPKAEQGILIGSNDGSTWSITRESTGDVGVTFTINNSGQLLYTSTNTSVGVMKFAARSKTI